MRTLALVLLAGIGAGLASAQESPYEDVAKKTHDLLTQINKQLMDIKDEASADTARPVLRKLAQEWVELRKKEKQLPPPERAEKDRLAKAYKEKMRVEVARLIGETTRVQAIPGGRMALQEISGIVKKGDE